jgi:hypothetical protein
MAHDPITRWENEGGAILSKDDETLDRPRAQVAQSEPKQGRKRNASDRPPAGHDARERGARVLSVDLPLAH